MTQKTTRRDFLIGGSITAASVWACGSSDAPSEQAGDASAPPASADAGFDTATKDARPDAAFVSVESLPVSTQVFPLGVSSGDPATDRAMLWVFAAGATSLEVVVWESSNSRAFSAPVVLKEGFGLIDATGLEASTVYQFAFVEAGAKRSEIGTFKTAPKPDAKPRLRFGAISCTKTGRSFAAVEQAAALSSLDGFLLLGDTSYNDGASTLADFRSKWRETVGSAEYIKLRRSTSAIATWDDHEVSNNWDPETTLVDQIDSAERSFRDHIPMRLSTPTQLWRSLRFGLTCEVFVLDSRGERKPSTRGASDATYLSRAQMDWFKQSLKSSPCVFKVILNSVPISDFPVQFLQENDRWEGYPAQRTEILSFIDNEAIKGALWVSGDFHLASSQLVSKTGPGATQREILVGPGAQTPNPLFATITSGGQFDFASGTNNVTLLELDPDSRTAKVSWIDGTGQVFETRSYIL